MSSAATITYSCGGCEAVSTTDPIPMRAERQPVFGGTMREAYAAGRSHVLCATVTPKLDAEDHAPEGWVVFDPYTLCTYCPECWQSIESEATNE